MKVTPLTPFLFLALACGGGEDLPESANGKVALLESTFQDMVETTCACPQIAAQVGRAACEAQKLADVASEFSAFRCAARIADEDPAGAVLSKGLECPIRVMLGTADCLVQADCNQARLDACENRVDKIEQCNEPTLSPELERRLEQECGPLPED